MHLPYQSTATLLHTESDTHKEVVHQRPDKTACYAFHEKAPRYTIASETHERGSDEAPFDLP